MERVVGGQSDVGRLRRVAVKHARDAFRSDASLDRQWRDLNYTAPPHPPPAASGDEGFLALLRGAGAGVHCLPPREQGGVDSLYVRDASIACDRGIILCNMGKPQRATEPAAQEAAFRTLGLPILGGITGDGRLEGGDVLWLDQRTLAVGRGYRTNDAGIGQLRALLAGPIDELILVPPPPRRGPARRVPPQLLARPPHPGPCRLYSPLLPVPFREALLARGITLVDVPDAEFPTLGCNVLAVAPRTAVMVAGNPETRARLERAGVRVHEFAGREICLKGGGGPT